MLVVVHGISNAVNPALLKAFSLIRVTEFGIYNPVSEEQSSNDRDPIVVNEPGRITFDKLVQPVKAQSNVVTE